MEDCDDVSDEDSSQDSSLSGFSFFSLSLQLYSCLMTSFSPAVFSISGDNKPSIIAATEYPALVSNENLEHLKGKQIVFRGSTRQNILGSDVCLNSKQKQKLSAFTNTDGVSF